ncbi:hypothetical protein [Rubneribacter sp.]|nr:hypothetical protein [Candidatus Rubneribacter avistercoris]
MRMNWCFSFQEAKGERIPPFGRPKLRQNERPYDGASQERPILRKAAFRQDGINNGGRFFTVSPFRFQPVSCCFPQFLNEKWKTLKTPCETAGNFSANVRFPQLPLYNIAGE